MPARKGWFFIIKTLTNWYNNYIIILSLLFYLGGIMQEREQFASRLGFILVSAGCAIGLGNIWRFPYIVGEYGGGAFVLIYLFFLVIFGIPILTMEFAVGRASRKSVMKSFNELEPANTKWHWWSKFALASNTILMLFYTTIAGWMLLYFFKMLSGDFNGLDATGVTAEFNNMLSEPLLMIAFMLIMVFCAMFVCYKGLKNGVEKFTKIIMIALLFFMIILAINSISLDGGMEGLQFYLIPDFDKIIEIGIGEVIFAAMGQAFFTLSIGVGSMAIFGSYLSKERSLTSEAIGVTLMDTFVAIVAGLIIFPACFAFGVDPEQGSTLIFITLPNIFINMAGGQFWGSLFFLFMTFAAFSTVIAVFENIICCVMEMMNISRKKSVLICLIFISIFSIPCILGFNIWAGFEPFGAGTNILDLEDFFVSYNFLPIGAIIYILFCTSRYGWGWDKFIAETDTGKGLKFPKFARIYVSYILPLVIFYIFIMGYYYKFF